MSQAKVDKYKEQKKNRAKIMKREKRERIIAEASVGIIALAIIIWAGVSIYQSNKPVVTNTYSVDSTALDDYMVAMNASDETEAESEAATEADTEGTSESEETTEAGSETEEVSETSEE